MLITNKSGCRPCGGIRFFFFLFVFLLSGAANAVSLAQLNDLAAGGAPQLALALLDQQQPSWQEDADSWIRWERRRIQLLATGNDWRSLRDRTAGLPADIPEKLSRWFATWHARALVELGDGAAARRILRNLLWQGGESNEIMDWRRLVIQSYRADGLADDAYAAMLRYRQDYGQGGAEDALLSAQVLLAQGRAADALEAMHGLTQIEAGPLRLLAQLRSDPEQAKTILQQARSLLEKKDLSRLIYQQAAAVAAEAAREAADPAAQAIALEQVFSHLRQLPLDRELFKLNVDSLWDAYLTYAQNVGNREQLLIGDDAAWLAKAKEVGRRQPILVRSIYVLLSLQAGSIISRQQAQAALLVDLAQQEGGLELLHQLYLNSSRYPETSSLPEGVRRVLIDPAIAAGDLSLAARLMDGLDEPSPGVDRVIWRLRQARLQLLDGEAAKAVSILEEMIAQSAALSRAELDRLIQVVFDLQTVGEHELAYQLFASLQVQLKDVQLKRELWYWMADARLAQDRPMDAAALYLRSAMVPQPIAQDPWGQTARYQAARALAKAGLLADARTLYERLLSATEDPGRRAVLRRELQELLLVSKP
ncbi:MAG: hypothetical protein WC965_07705 [Thiohalomonadaceae bacterium]